MYYRFMDDVVLAHNGQATRKGVYSECLKRFGTARVYINWPIGDSTKLGRKSDIYDCLVFI